jgi:hypothetical protein
MNEPMRSRKSTVQNGNLAQQFRLQSLYDLPIRHAHMILGLRHAMICRQMGQDPLDALSVKYRNVAAAALVVDMAQTALRIWPEKFMILRPCCRVITPDEAAVSAILFCAELGDRDAMQPRVGTLLRQKDCHALFDLCVHFADNLDPKIFSAP